MTTEQNQCQLNIRRTIEQHALVTCSISYENRIERYMRYMNIINRLIRCCTYAFHSNEGLLHNYILNPHSCKCLRRPELMIQITQRVIFILRTYRYYRTRRVAYGRALPSTTPKKDVVFVVTSNFSQKVYMICTH